jgi:tRNA nucleotidyltransferase (CCA-adding enzyme)
VLRAVRFAQRLGFTIEPRTSELIGIAREMLRRITGERLRNELTLLFKESQPERGLAMLQDFQALAAIHPALHYDAQTAADFAHLRACTAGDSGDAKMTALIQAVDLPTLYWSVWLCRLSPSDVAAICERFLMAKGEAEAFQAAARLVNDADFLDDPALKPSQRTFRLERYPELALLTVWLISYSQPVQATLASYLDQWRHIRPVTTGHDLKAHGLKPGPAYKRILERLRAARLDGEVITDDEERALLNELAAQEIQHESEA